MRPLKTEIYPYCQPRTVWRWLKGSTFTSIACVIYERYLNWINKLPDRVLSPEIPHLELEVLVFYGLHIEADCLIISEKVLGTVSLI